ncbi:MAG: cytochrome b N-terminal domain-containing protein [Anaerolineales bacterium]
MRRLRHAFVIVSLITIFLVMAVILGTPKAQAGEVVDRIQDSPSSLLRLASVHLTETTPPQPPEQDTCLHCHLSGSIDNIWTPLARWTVAGFGGLVFLFGAYKTGSGWITRKPWKPLWARAVDWLDDRFQIVEPMQKILKKPVAMFSTRWMYCLGGITFTLFIIQAVTGTMLAFYYKPTPEAAYASIIFIENEVRFGAAIRAIHHWSANGMVVMVVAHMVRVFIHGAFKAPRELNWVSGVLLLVLTFGFGLTGYLLPWDQRAYWATTVASEIAGGVPQIGDLALVFLRGGWDVSAVTLSRFYALHVLVIPVGALGLLGIHFLMVRRQGIHRPL